MNGWDLLLSSGPNRWSDQVAFDRWMGRWMGCHDWNPALVCPVVRRKPCNMWCESHAFHHFASNVHALFLVISWFIQKIFFTPTISKASRWDSREPLMGSPFDILEYILIPVIVLNIKWSYVKKHIHISWKWATFNRFWWGSPNNIPERFAQMI